MAITWHWEGEDLSGKVAHTRMQFHLETLCGKETMERALLRPPFFAVRCPICESRRGADVQVFPNIYSANT